MNQSEYPVANAVAVRVPAKTPIDMNTFAGIDGECSFRKIILLLYERLLRSCHFKVMNYPTSIGRTIRMWDTRNERPNHPLVIKILNIYKMSSLTADSTMN